MTKSVLVQNIDPKRYYLRIYDLRHVITFSSRFYVSLHLFIRFDNVYKTMKDIPAIKNYNLQVNDGYIQKSMISLTTGPSMMGTSC